MKRDDLHGLGLVLQLEGVKLVQLAIGWRALAADESHGINPLVTGFFWPNLGLGAAFLAAGLALVFARKLAGPLLVVLGVVAGGYVMWQRKVYDGWNDSLLHPLVEICGLPALALAWWAASPFRFVAGPRTRAMAAGMVFALPATQALTCLLALRKAVATEDPYELAGSLVTTVVILAIAWLAVRATRELAGATRPGRSRLTTWVIASSFGIAALYALVVLADHALDDKPITLRWFGWLCVWWASIGAWPWFVRVFAGAPPRVVAGPDGATVATLDAPAVRSDASFALAWLLVTVAVELGTQLLGPTLALMANLGHEPASWLHVGQLLRGALIVLALGAASSVLLDDRLLARRIAAVGTLVALGFTVREWAMPAPLHADYQSGIYATALFAALVWFLPNPTAGPPRLGDVFT